MKRRISSLLLGALLVTWPCTSRAQTLEEAYDNGYKAGVGGVLVVKGSLFTVAGGVGTTAAINAGGWGTVFLVFSLPLLLVGAGEVVAGAVLLEEGLSAAPAPDTRAEEAWEAGYGVGIGDTFMGLGSVFLTAGLVAFFYELDWVLTYGSDDAGLWWLMPTILGAVGAGMLGAGIALHVTGNHSFDAVQRGSGGGQSGFMMPVWTHRF